MMEEVGEFRVSCRGPRLGCAPGILDGVVVPYSTPSQRYGSSDLRPKMLMLGHEDELLCKTFPPTFKRKALEWFSTLCR